MWEIVTAFSLPEELPRPIGEDQLQGNNMWLFLIKTSDTSMLQLLLEPVVGIVMKISKIVFILAFHQSLSYFQS